MTEAVTHTLEVPGAVLHYDIRDSNPAGGPVLVMIGSPMGAAGFGTLATHFTDHTIVTYDPRGVERSKRIDPDLEVTPEVHAAGGEYGQTGDPNAFATRLRDVLAGED